MECVALKTSIRNEMAMFDDLLWGLHGQSSAVQNCEDFSVDDLLDFSNDDGFVADDEAHEDEEEDDNKPKTEQPLSLKAVTTPEEEEKEISTPSSCLSEKNELAEPNSELSVPADDLENLEWLSHFVEDSFSGYNASLPAVKPKNPVENGDQPKALKPCFKSPVPGKARSKRTRTGGRVWSTLGSPSLTESSSTSSSSSSSTTSSSRPLLMFATEERPRQQKKPKRSSSSAGGDAASGIMMEGPTGGGSTRRCSHCGVQKTPQWRTGPNGAKTLCNACGVRYKSGRLVPEYRPAGSPTFSSELHSNHHRKVMEIRRKKEVVVVTPEPGLMTTAAATPVVRSF